MKALLAGVLVLALTVPIPAQRIDTQGAERGVVKRVQTTLNHLTVIELAEPVVMAAAGSPSFKIERQGNKVLIQPIEEDATTNLFIWTASGRFSYELVPATSIETTDFAIDQKAYEPAKSEPRPGKDSGSIGSENEIRRQGRPIRSGDGNSDGSDFGVTITNVFQKGEQFFVRYEADTREHPKVFELKSPQAPVSLQGLRYSQIDSKIAAAIRDKGQQRIQVMDCETAAPPPEMSRHTSGILALAFKPKDLEPTVLRLVFPSAGSKSVSVFLVL